LTKLNFAKFVIGASSVVLFVCFAFCDNKRGVFVSTLTFIHYWRAVKKEQQPEEDRSSFSILTGVT
jgi:hypothetical protein